MKMVKQSLKLVIVTACIIIMGSMKVNAQKLKVSSPDKKIEVKINIEETITYSVFFEGNEIISPSSISMTLAKGKILGKKSKVLKSSTRSVDNIIKPVVREKRKEIVDQFNEIKIDFKGNFSLVFRAYNDGAAYRFETSMKGKITVYNEEVNFKFAKQDSVFFPDVTPEKYFSSFQRYYEYIALSSIGPDKISITPALVDIENGPKVVIAEADLTDYPGMYLIGNKNTTLTGDFAEYVLKEAHLEGVGDTIMERADYIAVTEGSRTFPWRVLGIAKNDIDLINSQLIYKLAKPCVLKDTDWIKPGKVSWDWWNANNIYGVDFRAGINTETYKYFIDFASKYKIEYVVIDDGWTDQLDITKANPEMDMEVLSKYAKEKNVGLVMWIEWRTFETNLEFALDLFKKYDVKGVKVDFMRRDDQYMVNYFHKMAKATAERELLINFHGAYEPTGLRRMYPNVISREGVKGLEQSKWSNKSDPEYHTALPFIRMFAGPLDYTPGAMHNCQKENFRDIFNRPMGMGTRCHELSMYIIFESPMQMLADCPSAYYREKEAMEFLSKVPTTWDETVVLDGKVADYVSIARQNGDEWYIGAMTDWTERDMEINFSYLGEGEYDLVYYQDGINADRCGNDYKKLTKTVTNKDTMKIHMAPGGGWVAIATPKKK